MLPRPAIQNPGQITLLEGRPEAQPTDYFGAVRIRAVTNVAAILGNPEEGTLLLGLQVSHEPKITWQGLIGLKIDKAIDDNDQRLGEAMAANGPIGIGGGAFPGGGIGVARPLVARRGYGISQFVPVHLKKGEKASKSLKELSGTISAEVLAEPKTLITTDEVLKSAGKTFKGDDGGSIKIVSVDRDEDGQATVVFELERPVGFTAPPMNGGGVFGGAPGVPVAPPVPAPRRIQILPNQPQPPGAGIQAQAGQVQPAPPGQVIQIQIQVGGAVQVNGGGAGATALAPFNGGTSGLKLVDDKGNTVAGSSIAIQYKAQPGGGRVAPEYVLTVPLKKEQTETGKLIFAASKSVTVDIPFSLKDIVLP